MEELGQDAGELCLGASMQFDPAARFIVQKQS
jgi:hypothetical protein